MKRKNNPDRFITKPFEGKRDATWAADRLLKIDERLGVGKGATRERERLNNIIMGVKKPAAQPQVQDTRKTTPPVSEAERRRRDIRKAEYEAKKRGEHP